MSNDNVDCSFKNIKSLSEFVPELADFISRYKPESYEEFLENLYINLSKQTGIFANTSFILKKKPFLNSLL